MMADGSIDCTVVWKPSTVHAYDILGEDAENELMDLVIGQYGFEGYRKWQEWLRKRRGPKSQKKNKPKTSRKGVAKKPVAKKPVAKKPVATSTLRLPKMSCYSDSKMPQY
jgi:hypothetical protein